MKTFSKKMGGGKTAAFVILALLAFSSGTNDNMISLQYANAIKL
jgi:hypothetical protein